MQFYVRDHLGVPTPTTEITTSGAFTGLNLSFDTKIVLPVKASQVEATLVHSSSPATMEAFNSDTSSARTATMTGPGPETLTISGSDIDRLIIKAPQNETLLLKFCYKPL